MKKFEKLFLFTSILIFIYGLFYFLFFFLFSNGIDFIIAFSFLTLIYLLYKQLGTYIYISLLNVHKEIWVYYMSLYGLLEILKNMIIRSDKLFAKLYEKKLHTIGFLLEVFDNNIAEINFFFFRKYLLNKYLAILSHKYMFIYKKKNEIVNLPFFLSPYSEYKLYKSYVFIELLKLFK